MFTDLFIRVFHPIQVFDVVFKVYVHNNKCKI